MTIFTPYCMKVSNILQKFCTKLPDEPDIASNVRLIFSTQMALLST